MFKKAFIITTVLCISTINFCCSGSNGSATNETDDDTTQTIDDGPGSDDDQQGIQGIRILPLGDSRVEGNRPDHESYRFELWKMLIDSDLDFDFVGTREDRADYPSHNGSSFDVDHEGTGGATTVSTLSKLDAILNQESAEIVLLGIGGNDLDNGASASETIANIERLIDGLQSKHPSITILLEQIAPATSDYMTEERNVIWEQFNLEIAAVAQTKSTATSAVIAVNMSTGWKDEYLADTVHYNEEGAKEVANRYFKVIDSLLTVSQN